MKRLRILNIAGLLFMAIGPFTFAAGSEAPKDAQPATQEANAAVLKELNFADQEDFADAKHGLIAPPASVEHEPLSRAIRA